MIRNTLLVQALLVVSATVGALVLSGWELALAVLVAGLVATGDLALLAYIVKALFDGKQRNRLAIGVILGLKFPVLLGAVYLMLNVGALDPLGAILGFSTLVVAVLYASVAFGLQSGKERK